MVLKVDRDVGSDVAWARAGGFVGSAKTKLVTFGRGVGQHPICARQNYAAVAEESLLANAIAAAANKASANHLG